ncbi:MAG: type II secretion system F family protein [Actinomycetota bacterium]|nr:type II secretion system F family protein [Acidimicrobiia bacterium]MDQ3293120.1 type II secretion system F family protein [Actinomycetota bacterium]
MEPAVIFGLLLVSAGVVALVAGLQDRTAPVSDDPEAYLRSLELDDEADDFTQRLREPFITRVLRPIGARAAGGLGSLLPANYRDQVHRKLVFAGVSGQYRAEEVITAQMLLAIVGLVAGLGLPVLLDSPSTQRILFLVALPVVGAMVPTALLNRKLEDRRESILKDLPDTLDLLAISVEAGLGFEGAIGIVCEHFDSPLADEFSRTLKEMELGLPRREALQNLKRRTEVPELSNFVLALTQADALGMPIGRVLKTQAGEMRLKRRQWAREKAAKLPVKIMFPLVLFIFPTIFIVVLGPAVSQIRANL